MTINNYRTIKHDKPSQCLFCLLIASVFIFCVSIQKNDLTIRIEPVKAEEPSELPLQPENEIKDKIYAVFGKDARIAYAVAFSESGLRNVKGDIPLEYKHDGEVIGHSCGIFQIRILPGRPTCEELMDVDTNIAYAKVIFDRFGWYPWTNFRNNVYKNYLK